MENEKNAAAARFSRTRGLFTVACSLVVIACFVLAAAGCSNPAGSSAAAAPTISVSGSGVARSVTITSSGGGTVYYTLDGSEPTTSSDVYSGALTVAGYYVTKTVKAIAVVDGTATDTASSTVTVTPSAALSLSGTKSTLAGSTTESGYLDDTGEDARFYYPFGITCDGENLYVVDNSNHMIRKIVIATGAVTTLAGSTTAGSSDGTGADASFNAPQGITTDGTYLYVADTSNNMIRQIVISTGAVTTLAGSTTSGSGDGTGAGARFNMPEGITTDGTNLYVSDSGNNKIRQIVISTGVVSTLTPSSSGVTGTYFTRGIVTDGTNLYIADGTNDKIKKMVISTCVVSNLAEIESGEFSGIVTDGTNLYATCVSDTSSTNASILYKIPLSTGVPDPILSTINNPNHITTDGSCLYYGDPSAVYTVE